ncbi:MAG TPA: hypothetical protein VGQ76_26290 [Thermoanaerobaculia bacterium]|jgi:hypothetical protein|nr:hypothetical protein [Thermoanaerobaculia bacterium]
MDHAQAIETRAAERYFLDELVDPERGAFEEHFFDCRICADTVRAGGTMFASGRKAMKEALIYQRFRRKTWLQAAAAALLVTIGLQFFIPGIHQSEPAAVVQFVRPGPEIRGVTRAGESKEVFVKFQGKDRVVIFVYVPPEPVFPNYRLEFRAPSGKVIQTFDVSGNDIRNEEGESLHLLLSPLPAGRYALSIEGVRKDGNRSEIVKHSVVVQ